MSKLILQIDPSIGISYGGYYKPIHNYKNKDYYSDHDFIENLMILILHNNKLFLKKNNFETFVLVSF